MRTRFAASLCLLVLLACTRKEGVHDFASRYARAWSSRHAGQVAEFFSPGGSLTINGGTPSVGRDAIAAAAQGFMTAFPDLKVTMDSVVPQGAEQANFYWTLVGTNSGPGGTGRPVKISGFEEWHFGTDGLIVESQGHYDSEEYRRQLTTP